jgi:hypothetical protein
LREAIAATEETWNRFCAGTTQVLPLFRTHTSTLSALVEELGHADYRRLVQAIAEVAGLLTQTRLAIPKRWPWKPRRPSCSPRTRRKTSSTWTAVSRTRWM